MIKQRTNDMGFSEYNRDPEFEYQKLDWVWVRHWVVIFEKPSVISRHQMF